MNANFRIGKKYKFGVPNVFAKPYQEHEYIGYDKLHECYRFKNLAGNDQIVYKVTVDAEPNIYKVFSEQNKDEVI